MVRLLGAGKPDCSEVAGFLSWPGKTFRKHMSIVIVTSGFKKDFGSGEVRRELAGQMISRRKRLSLGVNLRFLWRSPEFLVYKERQTPIISPEEIMRPTSVWRTDPVSKKAQKNLLTGPRWPLFSRIKTSSVLYVPD